MIFPTEHIHIKILGSKVILTFIRKELLYDIRNLCFVEGDLMEGDEHSKHQVFDVGEDGNVDRATRVLDLTFSQCVELCYPYSKREVKPCTRRDDELEYEDEYVMHLNVPHTFSETTVTLLEKYIHELLVYRVLEDWLGITKPDAAAKWKEKADNIETDIIATINHRTKVTRRKLSPW